MYLLKPTDSNLVFIDSEFIEKGNKGNIDLISIGLVKGDGSKYYAINKECDFTKANQWVKDHVLIDIPPYLSDDPANAYENGWRNLAEIKSEILQFLNYSLDTQGFKDNIRPQFWADYCSYDWVVFAQLFGTMVDLPSGFPMYCNDLQQLLLLLGSPSRPPLNSSHNALEDAEEAWHTYTYLYNIACDKK